jgi:3-isopropylmalate dehydrogenase
MLVGGLGIAPSANRHPGRITMFEPVHGSAPPLAGKDAANPVASILTVAMMLDTLGAKEASCAVENAVRASITAGITTADLGGSSGTRTVGDWIATRVREVTA